MRLRLATLNVWGLPEPFSRKPGARLDAIAGRLTSLELDAMAFQEVWIPSARARLARAGREAGLEHVWYKHPSLRGRGSSGLLVLSRHPIESVRFERFAIAGPPERVTEGDYLGGKGFVRLGLATPAGLVELVDTHLQAHQRYSPLRAGQVVQLALGLHDVRHPVIGLGDFNCGDGDPVYRILLGLTGLRDVAVVLDGCEPTLLRSNLYQLVHRRFDHRVDLALARDGRDRRVVPRSVRRIFDETFLIDGEPATYSDHAGVRVEVDVEAGPEAPLPTPDADIVQLARDLLEEGRNEAEGRRREHLAWAGAGIAGAIAVAVGERVGHPLTRRQLLRAGLQGAALLGLASSSVFSLLAERFEPSQIRTFRRLSSDLAKLADAPPSPLAADSARRPEAPPRDG